jgi:hypothetical protein
MDLRRTNLIVGPIVAGLWASAGLAWAQAWPIGTPDLATCTAAIERDTRAALAVDSTVREIPTPTECQGVGADGLAAAVAAMTPVGVPRLADDEPTARPTSASPRPRRTTPAPRRTTAVPAPERTTVTPTPDPSPSTEPTPGSSISEPTPSPSTSAPEEEDPAWHAPRPPVSA